MLVMVNTNMFRHPKYYKELRKRNKTGVTATTKRNIGHSQELSFGFSPPVKSDQVISFESGTPPNERAPGPGHKPQAPSSKLQAPSVKLSNQPVQAPSDKRPSQSNKRQASSHKQQAP